MEIKSFSDMREIIIENFRKKTLIPIIGSGFSQGSKSLKGYVPSGKEYIDYMRERLNKCGALSDLEKEELKVYSFSELSTVYHEEISLDERKEYLRNNFSKVLLDNIRKPLLQIDWPYIYTLNIDDAIEKNSSYHQIIYSNREVNPDIYDYEKCVIKLHGDINDLLAYSDSQSVVFTKVQYASSLKKNLSLLNKLEHDISYQNIIYLGCSLDDEIDILKVSLNSNTVQVNRYICVVDTPGRLEKIRYKQYGITHVLLFHDYDSMYTDIYNAWQDSKRLTTDDLDTWNTVYHKNDVLSSDFEKNKSYLFWGKSLLTKQRSIEKPYFFIEREITKQIYNNLTKNSIQFVLGSACSGKTYVLIDLACRIRNRKVYIFESKDSLSDYALKKLMNVNKALLLFDSSALTTSQIDSVIHNIGELEKKGINIVFFEKKRNRDLADILQIAEKDNINFPIIDLPNKFTNCELTQINQRLTSINAGIFSSEKTILDNIIYQSRILREGNKYQRLYPLKSTKREISVLISLAIERKLYSISVTQFGFSEEAILQVQKVSPLIDIEETWGFEKSPSKNSSIKYVLNAEYWLFDQLSDLATSNPNGIEEAYFYIVKKILDMEKIDGTIEKNNLPYKQYILFDNINQIFAWGRRGNLSLIRKIYDKLNTLLSTDPQYMHQRSKCYIRSSFYEKTYEKKIDFLKRASRCSIVAEQIIESRYKRSANEKLLISLAHVKYTRAIAECIICSINKYEDIQLNQETTCLLYEAMTSPYNSYAYAKNDWINRDNVMEAFVSELIINNDNLSTDTKKQLESLFRMFQEKNSIKQDNSMM